MDSKDIQQLNEAFAKASSVFKLTTEMVENDFNIIADIIEEIIITAAYNPSAVDEIDGLYQKAADLISSEYADLAETDMDGRHGGGHAQEWVNEISKTLREIVSFYQSEIGGEIGDVQNYIDTSRIIELATGAAHRYDQRDPTGQDEDEEGNSKYSKSGLLKPEHRPKATDKFKLTRSSGGTDSSDEFGAAKESSFFEDEEGGAVGYLKTAIKHLSDPKGYPEDREMAIDLITQAIQELGGSGNPDWEEWREPNEPFGGHQGGTGGPW